MDVEYVYTTGMDEAAVDARLRSARTGVLALARDGDAYAIPVAHYYDGDALYFRFGTTNGDRKREFWEATGTACYVIYGTEATDDARELTSWSVVVTGRLAELPASEHDRFDAAEINRRFAPIRLFDEDVADVDVTIAELAIETATGRTTPAR